MPITKTGYWKYKSYNVFDVESLSSYALEQTPLKFIPTELASDDYSDIYLIWDFAQKSFVASPSGLLGLLSMTTKSSCSNISKLFKRRD